MKNVLKYSVPIAAVILGVFIGMWLFGKTKPANTKQNRKEIERIETRLQPIYQKAEYHEKLSNDGKRELNALGDRFDELNEAFEHYKRGRDTVFLLAYCDSIRNDYSQYRVTAQTTIAHLDSLGLSWKYISKSKDTIIQIQKSEIKDLTKANRKLKWQRNLSIVGNAILTGLVILK